MSAVDTLVERLCQTFEYHWCKTASTLEAYEAKIAALTAERDALREKVEAELTRNVQWQSFVINLSNGEAYKHLPSGETEFVTKAEFHRVGRDLTDRVRAALRKENTP